MKITIEHGRGEGGTTLMVFIRDFLKMLGYKVHVSARHKAEEKRLEKIEPDARQMLTEERDVILTTKSYER